MCEDHLGTAKQEPLCMANSFTLDHRNVSTRISVLFLSVVVAIQSGCAIFPQVPPTPKTQYQSSLGKVAIVAVPQVPEIKLTGFAQNKAEGALKGAGNAFANCVAGMGGGGCSGDMCGAAFALWLAICGVIVAPVGAMAGAVEAPTGKETKNAKSVLSTALDTKTIQEVLRDKVIVAAFSNGTQLTVVPSTSTHDSGQLEDYRPLGAKGVDTVLEVALTKIRLMPMTAFGTKDSGINLPLTLVITAHVRLIHTADNTEAYSSEYSYLGKKMKLSDWSAKQVEGLLLALNIGYETLGAHIYDNLFLLYPFPSTEHERSGRSVVLGLPHYAFGLMPIYPIMQGDSPDDDLVSDNYTDVNKLQPTLQWQKFPRASDIGKAPKEMERVKNVRYDLLIARERNWTPAEIIYRREGLASIQHRLEIPLKTETRYFWTVRARFDLDGRERVTEWASTNHLFRQQFTSPNEWSYRFRTR